MTHLGIDTSGQKARAPEFGASSLIPHHSSLSVGAMFDGIAPRYDLMNRLMSAGQDARWRRIAVRSLGTLPRGPVLDIGVGTGAWGWGAGPPRRGDRVVGGARSNAMGRVAAEKGGGALRRAPAEVP